MHATEFIDQDQHEIAPFTVVYGSERHLRQAVFTRVIKAVLGSEEDDEMGLVRFAGGDTDWKTVSDELRMVSMWGDQRIVLVEDADDFVSKNRPALEKYAENPANKSVLVLDVRSFPKNTKLAKKVVKTGLDIDCSELKGSALTKWLSSVAKNKYERPLTRDAASLLVEFVGSGLGLLDQELAKLAAFVGEREKITAEDVRAVVGGWKAETTWTMINATRDGDMDSALACLDKLLVAGEAPQKILGGINFVFRKLAHATEIARSKVPLKQALRQAGVFPNDVAPSERYLRRIGFKNAERLLQNLVKADGNMKGGRRISDRLQVEQLLFVLSGTADDIVLR